jgi:hypothetical protein
MDSLEVEGISEGRGTREREEHTNYPTPVGDRESLKANVSGLSLRNHWKKPMDLILLSNLQK